MDAANIQLKINHGEAIGALKVGEPCEWFRPYAALIPAVAPAARMGTLLAYFDPDFKFGGKAPNLYGKPVLGALMDRSNTQPGDYLVAGSGTYFIAGQQPLLPTIAVQCSATITVSRPPQPITGRYSGRTEATDVPLLVNWPASVLAGGRTQNTRTDLPGDVQDKGYLVLVPAFPGVSIQTSDRIEDDQGRAFTVSSAERTDLGFRLDAILSAN